MPEEQASNVKNGDDEKKDDEMNGTESSEPLKQSKTFVSALKSILNIPSESDVFEKNTATNTTNTKQSGLPKTSSSSSLVYSPYRTEDENLKAANLRVFEIKSSYDFPDIEKILQALYNDDVIPYYRHKSFTMEYAIKFGVRIQLTEKDRKFLNENKGHNEDITSLWKQKLDFLHKTHFYKLKGNKTYCNVNYGEKNCDVFFDDTFSMNEDSCFFMIRIFRKLVK